MTLPDPGQWVRQRQRSGNSSVTADMLNLVYDIPLGDKWKLSLGGGVGGGDVRIHSTVLQRSGDDA